jgi:hypothetical protein
VPTGPLTPANRPGWREPNRVPICGHDPFHGLRSGPGVPARFTGPRCSVSGSGRRRDLRQRLSRRGRGLGASDEGRYQAAATSKAILVDLRAAQPLVHLLNFDGLRTLLGDKTAATLTQRPERPPMSTGRFRFGLIAAASHSGPGRNERRFSRTSGTRASRSTEGMIPVSLVYGEGPVGATLY